MTGQRWSRPREESGMKKQWTSGRSGEQLLVEGVQAIHDSDGLRYGKDYTFRGSSG